MFAASKTAAPAAAATYIEDVFSTWLYTGNDATQAASTGINLSTKGGLVWTKRRNGAASHFLVDTVRGNNKPLSSNSTAAQTVAGVDYITPTTTGYTVENVGNINTTGETYASWTFAKQAKFFDVVTYTGDGVTGRTVAHNLGSVPGCIIIKRTSNVADWIVYHRSIGAANGGLKLNTTTGTDSALASRFNYTDPTATEFTLGAFNEVNANGNTYVAYLFAHDAGGFGLTGTDNVISCGSVTNTTTVNLGYEPQWIMLKRTDSTSPWYMIDNMRGMDANYDDNYLAANSSAAEALGGLCALNATGMTLAVAGTYIYIAIRRGPMKTPTTGTSVFTPAFASSSGTYTAVAGFPVDLNIYKDKSGSTGFTWDRLRGSSVYLQTTSTAAEVSDPNGGFDSNTSFTYNTSGNFSSYINWMFRRAPGFFDVVCWTGNDVAGRNLSHNLGVAPEFMITKARDGIYNWTCWHSSFGNTNTIPLNTNFAKQNTQPSGSLLNTNGTSYVAPTASVFTVGLSAFINSSSFTYVAYLFASCPGVSKVGSYTGTGTTLQIDCGFTGGARFVLIKRTDSTGDWYVWDSARGIVSGNDPYLLLNSTAAEVTNTDYVDTYSAGFEISSTAPAAINANGGTFVFLAVA